MARGEQRGGRAFKFGDDVSTDLITAGRHMHLRGDLAALAEHAMEDADPTFARRVRPGDYLVAGENFGMGSSREHAPLVLKQKGVAAVIARSVARIFFRNAINVGLPVLICDTAAIGDGDRLRVDLRKGLVVDETTGAALRASPMPSIMLRVLQEGGLKPFIRTHGGFDVLAEDPPARARPDAREPRQDSPV